MGWNLFQEDEKTYWQEFEDALPSLTYQQRIYGFAFCFGAGWIINFLSAAFLPRINTPQGAAMFALFYTLGNIIAICSSCFLWGPCAQLKSMTACHRLFATCLYFTAMILTLFCAFYQGDGYTDGARIGAVIGCMIFQMAALTWYTLSFIPFARTIIKTAVAKCCGC
mmetsp:Transcript_7673/g.15027  ORF Transcript_7673/g.15027 Transcript_7673/m.15027 type:complete len:167 (-) Transcript_7673:404-904(-)